jgi:hypothetical protein
MPEPTARRPGLRPHLLNPKTALRKWLQEFGLGARQIEPARPIIPVQDDHLPIMVTMR